ncbi:hypothetical protein SDC9_121870 [bioreactor metagenome]|uniref:Uncharacterized protein n=1 Tax=bioreactor metagenome TaxID=1076179 RepID=A0A645CD96_9ZZZZ
MPATARPGLRLPPARRRPCPRRRRPSLHPRLRRLPASWLAASRCAALRACWVRAAPSVHAGRLVGRHRWRRAQHPPRPSPQPSPRWRGPPACPAPAVPAARHRSGTRPHRLPRTGHGARHRLPARRHPALQSAPADAGRRQSRVR